MKEDKRRFLRLGAFLEGTFQIENSVISGLVMLTDFSRAGVKASINRKLEAGTAVKFEIWMPGSIIPVFFDGEIVWIKPGSKEWTYSFDAGIKVNRIDQDDRQRLIDFAYEHWRNTREKK
ncbi:MAG: PilZ domain-containing protein [Candidatus Omnitrophica bacterium]|nr:PilZ domain-containing protein [Candidatus Omnitrophota bacterium]